MTHTNLLARESFVELGARERAHALLDAGSGRELIDPFARVSSPWLARQGVVTQADDGVVVIKGTIHGHPTVVLAIEGAFQGGSLGEVGGAKMAGALERAAEDNRAGIPTRAVLLLETGGVRLQEANLGLAAIADIHAAITDLRRYQPVVGVIAGTVGCFGGMSIAAGLCSYLVVTREARLGLNGPAVIEQEAGIAEYDSRDRPAIWSFTGGEQRYATHFVDAFVDDDTDAIRASVGNLLDQGVPATHRSDQYAAYLQRLAGYNPAVQVTPADARRIYAGDVPAAVATTAAAPAVVTSAVDAPSPAASAAPAAADSAVSRGATWFDTLTGHAAHVPGYPAALRVADGVLGAQPARYLAVVPDPANPYPRVRHGEVGLVEGWLLAQAVMQAVEADRNALHKRAIVAVVDVASQAYGRREEALGIHQALAGAAGAYAHARQQGHPVIALLVGKAMSGAFLAHGYQANRLIALDDAGVLVHAMGKAAAARITQRNVEEMEKIAATVPPMAYDVGSYATLGLLWRKIPVTDADAPAAADVAAVQEVLQAALTDIAADAAPDLATRLGGENRQLSSRVRALLNAQW